MTTCKECDSNKMCNSCFYDLFQKKIAEGEDIFYQWLLDYFGKEKADELFGIVYGEEMEETNGEDEWEIYYKNKEPMTMFTYGILKYPHRLRAEGASNIIPNCTVKGHVMYSYHGSFPVTKVTARDDDVIYGTLFEVPANVVLYQYDKIEGYHPNQPKEYNMYNREKVQVTKPDGEIVEAEMYIANQRTFAKSFKRNSLIKSGNFDDVRQRI